MSAPPSPRARTPDVPAIHDLIEHYAGDRILLAKERVQLYEDVQDFWVADQGGRWSAAVPSPPCGRTSRRSAPSRSTPRCAARASAS